MRNISLLSCSEKIKWLLILFIFNCSGMQAATPQFVHPGMLHSKANLDLLRAKVNAGKQPQKSAWKELLKSKYASLDIAPRAVPDIHCGSYNKPNIGGTEFYQDGNFAYTMALLWYVTQDERYARKTIEILNDWSYTLVSVTNTNQKLKIGVGGIKYLNAAEIIKHTYQGWNDKDQKAFEKMLLNIWYPVIEDFSPRANGNWDAAIGQTMMCIGIYLDRQDIFDRAYSHLLQGKTNGAISNYFIETGQCQESGRDQGHVQMGLSYLANACEIAWTQGKDLYSAYDCLLAKGYEYTSRYMLGLEVPYVRYKVYYGEYVFTDKISSKGRTKYYPIREIAYHHYHNRLGMKMPYTKRVLKQTRNEGDSGDGYIPWGTLMWAGYP